MAFPEPRLGLVISYAYLWHYEHRAGLEDGRKHRPCVIILAIERPDKDVVTVRVAPVTHRPPKDMRTAYELPHAVKQNLGLDGERSWVILDEVNEFAWPGYDLRPIPRSGGQYAYGFLPPRLFNSLMTKLGQVWQAGIGKATPRD
jgi:hypothetical protein